MRACNDLDTSVCDVYCFVTTIPLLSHLKQCRKTTCYQYFVELWQMLFIKCGTFTERANEFYLSVHYLSYINVFVHQLDWYQHTIAICPPISYVFISINTILVTIVTCVNVHYALHLNAFTIYNWEKLWYEFYEGQVYFWLFFSSHYEGNTNVDDRCVFQNSNGLS